MMKGDPLQTSGSTDLEDDRELWQLLARSRRTEAGSYFARRVLREAALLPQGTPSSALWRGLKAWWQAGLPLLRPPRAAAWPGALAAVVICTLTVMTTLPYRGENLSMGSPAEDWDGSHPQATATAGPLPDRPTESSNGADDASRDDLAGTVALASDDSSLTQQDAEVIADLDSLMAHEETHLWTDDSTVF